MDSSVITAVFQSAGAGTALIVVLVLLGLLAPRNYIARVEREADRWHAAYTKSDEEAEELRKALAVQVERADNATATALRQAEILERLQSRIR